VNPFHHLPAQPTPTLQTTNHNGSAQPVCPRGRRHAILGLERDRTHTRVLSVPPISRTVSCIGSRHTCNRVGGPVLTDGNPSRYRSLGATRGRTASRSSHRAIDDGPARFRPREDATLVRRGSAHTRLILLSNRSWSPFARLRDWARKSEHTSTLRTHTAPTLFVRAGVNASSSRACRDALTALSRLVYWKFGRFHGLPLATSLMAEIWALAGLLLLT
jgi:hypothetical protein